MNILILIVGWALFLFFVARDVWLVWFAPRKFIEQQRKIWHFQMRLAPFLKRFYSYPDEGFVLQYNKVLLPILLILLILAPLFLLILALTR